MVMKVSEEVSMSVGGGDGVSTRSVRRSTLYMYAFGGVVGTFAAPFGAIMHGTCAWLHNFGRVRASV
jgi:hypothetical protein